MGGFNCNRSTSCTERDDKESSDEKSYTVPGRSQQQQQQHYVFNCRHQNKGQRKALQMAGG